MQTDPLVDFLLSNRIHSLKYLRSTTLGSKDIGIRNITTHFPYTFLSNRSHSMKYETPACEDIEIGKL